MRSVHQYPAMIACLCALCLVFSACPSAELPASPSSANAITSFSFKGLSGATSMIAGNYILVDVPEGTNLQNLVAQYTTTGASVKVNGVAQVSGATENDFTSGLTYVVTASDGGTRSYTVKASIQYAAEYAITAFAGDLVSQFWASAVDSMGNVYVAGSQEGTGAYDYGNSVSATGSATTKNAVLVKYAPDGTALWARTVSEGSDASEFKGVAFDSSGNVYAVGNQKGTGKYVYSALGATPERSAKGTSTIENPVLVKYSSDGTAQWARTASAGSNYSYFEGVVTDSAGNVYVAGYQGGVGKYTYNLSGAATEVSVTGKNGGPNCLLLKYSSDGTVQWAQTASAASDSSTFKAVAIDSSGNLYLAGNQSGTGAFEYGLPGTAPVQATGSASNYNALLVKYASSGTALWAKTIVVGTGSSMFLGLAVDPDGNAYAVGSQTGMGLYTYSASGASATGVSSQGNSVIVKYAPDGTAQWARTASAGSDTTTFQKVAVDAGGNAYAVGYQRGTVSFTYSAAGAATTVSLTGKSRTNNPVLVKYASDGSALWARSFSLMSYYEGEGTFYGVSLDSAGSAYAAGYQTNASTQVITYTYSVPGVIPAVTATGPYVGGKNCLLVKY